MDTENIFLPLDNKAIRQLKTGQLILLNGTLITARDNTHKRICHDLKKGNFLPFSLAGQTIYYVGPTPQKPGKIIGSAGPTTSSRMDAYTKTLLAAGIKCMIGKGKRTDNTKKEMLKYQAVYLAAVGGAGALLSNKIINAKVIAYPELGAEAVYELEVHNFPVVVINDIFGGDLYIEGRNKYRI